MKSVLFLMVFLIIIPSLLSVQEINGNYKGCYGGYRRGFRGALWRFKSPSRTILRIILDALLTVVPISAGPIRSSALSRTDSLNGSIGARLDRPGWAPFY